MTSEGTDAIIEEEVGTMLSTSKFHCERTFKAGTADSDIDEMEGYLESLNSLGWTYTRLASHEPTIFSILVLQLSMKTNWKLLKRQLKPLLLLLQLLSQPTIS